MPPKAASKTAPAKVPSHPPWVEMIKECIAAHREDARIGVSRPQIKKFVEATYNLELGPAQVTQLNKAISNGADKGTFYLPKGLSGRVKLPPKTVAKNNDTDTKENKPAKASRAIPAKKAPAKSVSKSRSTTTTTKATKSPAAKKPTTKEAKDTTKKATVKKDVKEPKVAAKPEKRGSRTKANTRKPLKPSSKSTTKAATTKKTTSSSRRDTAKREVTGKKPASRTPASKTRKSSESKTATAKAATKTAAKPSSKQTSKPTSATKRKTAARK